MKAVSIPLPASIVPSSDSALPGASPDADDQRTLDSQAYDSRCLDATPLDRSTRARVAAGQPETPRASGEDASSSDADEPVTSLVGLLEKSARQYAARPLFWSHADGSWQPTSYAQFADRVDRLRAGLALLGVRRGDHVGVIAANSVEWALVAYASYGLGAVLVPMYESQHELEWLHIMRDSAIKVLFVSDQKLADRLADWLLSVPSLSSLVVLRGEATGPCLSELLDEAAGERCAAIDPAPSDVATLLYTSGTTGEPRGVVLSHANILSNVLPLVQVITAHEAPTLHKTLSIIPWAHALGHTVELHTALASGASIALCRGLDRVAQDVGEVHPTVLVAVPAVFLRIHAGVESLVQARSSFVRWLFRRGLRGAKLSARGARVSFWDRLFGMCADQLIFSKVRARLGGQLRFAISGAAALPVEVTEFMHALGVTVYEGYGLTEASPIVSANVPGQCKLGSVGRPLPGVSVSIDESVGQQPGHGEIVVFGSNVMRGYHGQSSETQHTLTSSGGLRTGDLGYLDDEGFLFVTGRLKERYKLSNGKYVAPAALEDQLKLSPLIANVMLHGANHSHNVALVVIQAEALFAWANDNGLRGLPIERLVTDDRVKGRYEQEIDRLSLGFKSYQRIVCFQLLANDFARDNGMLTPSLKLRRHTIEQVYADVLETLHAQAARFNHKAPRAARV